MVNLRKNRTIKSMIYFPYLTFLYISPAKRIEEAIRVISKNSFRVNETNPNIEERIGRYIIANKSAKEIPSEPITNLFEKESWILGV